MYNTSLQWKYPVDILVFCTTTEIRNNYSIFYWVRIISANKVSHTYWGELEELQVFMDEQNG